MVTVENHIGKISVTENYLTELIRHAVCDCFGVADVCNVSTFRSAVSSLTGGRLFKRKGVLVRTDDNGSLIIDLHIKVTYGTNISAAVRRTFSVASITPTGACTAVTSKHRKTPCPLSARPPQTAMG